MESGTVIDIGGIYLDVPAFKCPVCGGDVGAELDIWGEPKVMSVIFKCHRCGRSTDIDATDLLGEAQDYFDDELVRIEGE